MVLISNVIFTLTELFLLGKIFKEFAKTCDDSAGNLLNIEQPIRNPILMTDPNDACSETLPPNIFVSQTFLQHDHERVFIHGCWYARPKFSGEGTLYGWLVYNDKGVQYDFGTEDYPNITADGIIIYRS
jgi:hypothetical protein